MRILLTNQLFTRMSVLHVAEKNSIAKEVSNILSHAQKRTLPTLSKYNPIFEFNLNDQVMKFTSVRGHIFDYELPPECKTWATFDNKKILMSEVPMIKKLGPGMEDVVKNLEQLAKKSTELVLWLDCDRQGEAIAFEVMEVCLKMNPRLRIERARFSAVTPTDIWNAYENLVRPNQNEADAVNFRIQIDFRLGCTFTRFQTVNLSRVLKTNDKGVISYGPCQMPTLSFVVDRYLEIINFKPEKFWFIQAICVIDENTGIPFTWGRKNTRDEVEANKIMFNMIDKFEDGNVEGKVKSKKRNNRKKYRPFPLTTVKFQKLATDKLRMSSAEAMQIAEKLYQKGYISYPRTETNSFPKTMNMMNLIGKLTGTPHQNYINKLVNQNKFEKPKVGDKDDEAHTPIHPVKSATEQELGGRQWQVYDLILRHFLACCSKDAIGEEFQVKADIGGQDFKASYLTIIDKNYLEIYPYERWVETSFPAQIPDTFPVMLTMKDSKTTPPSYLTEAQLIDLMEKNQIGTDSTIHQHIETIQKRQYAVKNNNTFKPTNLGSALVQAYRKLNVQLPECDIRRQIQQKMGLISGGSLQKQIATRDTLNSMVPIYEKLLQIRRTWIQSMKEFLEASGNLPQIATIGNQGEENRVVPAEPIGTCQSCGSPSVARYSEKFQSFFLGCTKYPSCKWTHSLPSYISKIEYTDEKCSKCESNHVIIYRKEDKVVEPVMMRVRFEQSENNTVKVCLTPKCDPDLYNSFMSRFQPREPQPRDETNTMRAYSHFQPQTNQANRSNPNMDTSNTNTRKVTCFKCGKQGHFAPQCPQQGGKKLQKTVKPAKSREPRGKTQFACFSCGERGHLASDCPKKNNGKEKKERKEKKVCPQCGVEGRHPKNSGCSLVKRKKKHEQ